MTVKRPALKYAGGKWRLAPWIIKFMPPHTHYIEPCFGAGNVLLRKEQVELETVNDINGRLVNFFKQLRDDPERLIRHIETTPWAREEYELSQTVSNNNLEDARRMFYMCWMSVKGGPNPTGFRVQKKRSSRWTTAPHDSINHALYQVAERIRQLQILNLDAIEFIEKFNNDPNGLIYFDPPYPREERTADMYGEFELFDELHEPAAALLKQSKSHVIVSGYRNGLYDELYSDWIRFDKQNRAQSNVKRIESLWIPRRTVEALKNEKA